MKKDFPIFQKNLSLVYLDSAATSQKPQVVLDAMQEYYTTYNANARRGLYEIAEKATLKIEEVRAQVAQFINAKSPEEIIFVRNATEAINLVAYSLSSTFIHSEAVATTIMEHHSNFVPWQQLAYARDIKFEVIEMDESFKITVENIKKIDLKNTRLLAITHVSNVLGTINPIKEITQQVKKINPSLVVLVDAAQSVPHMKIDVQDLDCDFLVFSGHKLYAATGIGVLYGKKKLLETMPPFLFGGEMIKEVSVKQTTFASPPHKFEAGTLDIAGIVSLGAAIDYINSTGIKNIQNHEKSLSYYCLSLISKFDGITVLGSANLKDRGSVISFTMNGIHPHDIAQILGDANICIRAGHHCAMPLHKRLGIPASARVSFGIYNTEEDIEKFIKGLKRVKKIFNKAISV